MNNYEEKTVASEVLYKGKIITLKVDDVVLPNGKKAKRELIEHPGAVAILPITEDGKLVLVEQYRKALGRTIVEIPAGKLEEGEAPELTAIRELEEETGYGAGKLTFIQSFATSPGFADEIIHLYLAEELFEIESPAEGDDDEFVELMEATIEEAMDMMATGAIYDAKTAYAVLFAKSHLNE